MNGFADNNGLGVWCNLLVLRDLGIVRRRYLSGLNRLALAPSDAQKYQSEQYRQNNLSKNTICAVNQTEKDGSIAGFSTSEHVVMKFKTACFYCKRHVFDKTGCEETTIGKSQRASLFF